MLRSSCRGRFPRKASCGAWGPAVLLSLALVLALAPPARADRVLPVAVHTIRDDPGGAIGARVRQVAALRAEGARVRITGGCWSSCTMLLALPGACVTPSARLGFHGPGSGRYGIALSPAAFERWSRVMASHYPEPLRGWYLREGRNITVGFTVMRGAELIRLGIPAC